MKELTKEEMEKTNGGVFWFLVGLTIAMLNDADNNPDDFNDGYCTFGGRRCQK